ncbi:MAG: bifunctional phosphoserine phosphatase/homoserine phosphotransferase ThrH [Caldilineae bacterium]|nr:MAG: bifunctional phosphoserine phosphatase/homoserine phosphotransferase ThrH [Caldilineae bacterium]
MTYPPLFTLDLEGVFTPEIWITVAERSGIPELRRTTRDEPDYDKLMRYRLDLLRRHGLTLHHIRQVIAGMDLLPGACDFLRWLQERGPVIILSDTFYEFATPLLAKLGYPTLFCNSLRTDSAGLITDYILRLPDGKRQAVRALKDIHFRVIAIGDSYNDITMLLEADHGILFRPPPNVMADYPQLPVTTGYPDLQKHIQSLL